MRLVVVVGMSRSGEGGRRDGHAFSQLFVSFFSVWDYNCSGQGLGKMQQICRCTGQMVSERVIFI